MAKVDAILRLLFLLLWCCWRSITKVSYVYTLTLLSLRSIFVISDWLNFEIVLECLLGNYEFYLDLEQKAVHLNHAKKNNIENRPVTKLSKWNTFRNTTHNFFLESPSSSSSTSTSYSPSLASFLRISYTQKNAVHIAYIPYALRASASNYAHV